MPDHPAYRLPRTVTPKRYELTLSPDLDAATFAGEERVRVTVHEPVTEVVLNALDLDIAHASVTGDDGVTRDAVVSYRPDEQQAVLTFAEPVPAGEAIINATFTGTLNDLLVGFYRSTFTDQDGRERVIATTQFEATDARRAFPCWDEPDFKAVFAVTLVVDDHLTALSNGAAEEVTPLENGRVQVRFADTIAMSTYLVAFVVGPLELSREVDVDGVPLRVACVPGKLHLTEFALDAGAFALRYFTDWFGLPYPGDKLDLVAIPDFAFGAMENLGCVTFRETALLVDPATASQVELERIADVIAHEIAHMWFGDLVTMKWWNGIWLNEAFATFMELKCVDAFRPEWQRWTTFARDRAEALVTDGLATTRPVEFAVERPEEADAMFDILTYQKGAGVVRMLEQYVGEEPFRLAIGQYIKDNSYGNTETTDLWDAIEAGTGEPIRAAMDTWIFQGGYPLVTAELDADPSTLDLAQVPFRYGGGGQGRWQVPVTIRTLAHTDADEHTARLLLHDEAASVPVPAAEAGVVVNSGGWGFYRVRYAPALTARLAASLDRLDPIERFNLLGDSWAAALAGQAGIGPTIELIGALGDESDPAVWEMAFKVLRTLRGVLVGDDRSRLEAFVRRTAGPALDRLGWEPAPGESPRAATARGELVAGLGSAGADPEVRARAAELHDRYLADRSAVSGDLAGPITGVVAVSGGEAEYSTFLDRARHAETPQEELRYLYALATVPHEALAHRTIDLCLDEIRSQNAPMVVRRVLESAVGEAAWPVVEEKWDALMQRIPAMLRARMIGGVSEISDPETAARIRAFLAEHPLNQGQQTVEQHLERMDVLVAFRQREADNLAAVLAEVDPAN